MVLTLFASCLARSIGLVHISLSPVVQRKLNSSDLCCVARVLLITSSDTNLNGTTALSTKHTVPVLLLLAVIVTDSEGQ